MTRLEFINTLSELIFHLKKQIAQDETKLNEITQAYLETEDSGLLEQLEKQRNIVIGEYKQLSEHYMRQSILYLELNAQEESIYGQTLYLQLASEKMRLFEETTTILNRYTD